MARTSLSDHRTKKGETVATLTALEQVILEEIDEDLTTAEVWDGTGELREALSDAIDEACFFADLFEDRISIGLKADTMFYSLASVSSYPLFAKRAYLREQEREIDCSSLVSISKRDPYFMLARSAPREYVPLSPALIMVYPCYSSDGGVVELDVIACPKHYSEAANFLTLREELEQALVCYGKYYLMMRAGGMDKMALGEYEEYLKAIGALQEFKHHHRAMAQFRYKAMGES